MTAGSGLPSGMPFASFDPDPDSSCWRTWGDTLDGGSPVFSETWPRSGMTHGGVAYRRPPWAHPISGSGCSSSHTLPTPSARDWKSGASNIMDRNARPLNEVVTNLLPTPTATRYGTNQTDSPGAAVRPGLDSIAALLPTPQVADANGHYSRSRQDGRGGELLLPGVLRSLGTGGDGLPPSNGGNGSPDPPLTLWNWGDGETDD